VLPRLFLYKSVSGLPQTAAIGEKKNDNNLKQDSLSFLLSFFHEIVLLCFFTDAELISRAYPFPKSPKSSGNLLPLGIF
jgi:hypothetical protein